MKKKSFAKAKNILPIFCVALALNLTACHDAIFYMIDQEVEKEDGLEGDIVTITRFNGYLYTANGGAVYQKAATPSSETGRYNGQWSKVSSQGLSGYPFHVASNGTYLYALTITFYEDTDDSTMEVGTRNLYYLDGSSWKQIDSYKSGRDDKYKIFDNGGDSPNKAYFLKGGTTYELSGTSKPTSEKGSGIMSAAGDKTSTANALATNGSIHYWSSGSDIYYGSDPDGTGTKVSVDHGEIYSIAVTADHLLLGTSGGLARVALNSSGVPVGSTKKFSNNAQSLVTSRVYCVYVLDSSKNEGDTDEYAGMIVTGNLSVSNDTFEENGLYAFYPGRGNWNRDGD